ncbi:alpha/beta hydrolase family protein [Amycolatopsis sp. NPDC058986]|uniref:alpha/beta hydrolase family protein n=1 Tax=unclassified Amycolatopsis TaxID=2618356 RepID=UPI00366A6D16
MIARRLLVLVSVVLAGFLGVSASASAVPALSLPDPGGPYPIGRQVLHLVDTGRADPWRPAQRRELMVSMWYPAVPVGKPSTWVTPAESAAMIAGRKLDLPPDTLSRVRVHARENAPVLPSPGRPLVLLSPGAGNSRSTLTALAERLASKGYVVAGIDHAYEGWGVEFPGGRLLSCIPCGQSGDPWPRAIAGRVPDVSFVLDTLLRDRRWPIDPARIGMAGHSAGGSATAAAMTADRRIRAGVDLDGPLFAPVSIDRPFAVLESPLGSRAYGASWTENWPRLTGWKQRLLLEDSGHSTGTDEGILVDQLGLRGSLPPEQLRNQYGSIDSSAGLDFYRDYLTNFFGGFLKGAR